ncbi:hypothetical protein J3458_004734 [Metarhizium acridum]|uniref:uncharacterized protein n=1 Tax=Metarhizium acridum TaxID=92637 RepID=UPI001C6AEC3F|nr:hypothetical protein J3458_004734 [Metarhizium acridum]
MANIHKPATRQASLPNQNGFRQNMQQSTVVEIALLRIAWDGHASLLPPPPPGHITGNPTQWQPALLMVGKQLVELTTEEEEQRSIIAGMKALASISRSLRPRVMTVVVKKEAIILQTEDSSSSE